MSRSIPYRVAEYNATLTLKDGTTVAVYSPSGQARNEAIGIVLAMREDVGCSWASPVLVSLSGTGDIGNV